LPKALASTVAKKMRAAYHDPDALGAEAMGIRTGPVHGDGSAVFALRGACHVHTSPHPGRLRHGEGCPHGFQWSGRPAGHEGVLGSSGRPVVEEER
jgi:hypothetical protein